MCFEAPHRLHAALADLLAVLGDRPIAVCRELTKLYEEIYRGTIAEAQAHFAQPRGEVTLVIGGAPPAAELPAATVIEMLQALRQSGRSAREAVAEASAVTGQNRRALYQLWLQLGESGQEAP